jgi:RsiW-degrading membrane proteinase PrsW (M82 family)
MKSSGVTESINPDIQFQEYDDLSNKVRINANGIIILCSPVIAVVGIIFQILQQIFPELHCDMGYGYDLPSPFCLLLIWSILISVPLLPIYLYQNSNLEMISILYAVYLTGCIFSIVMVLV